MKEFLYVFNVVWAVGFTAAIITCWRRARFQIRQEFPDPLPAEPNFHETWASGRSFRNTRTRFGGAGNCLEVVLTDNELWIRLSRPFSYLMSGAEFDLMHRIPHNRIHTVKPLDTWSKKVIEIEFTDSEGELHRLHLAVRDRERFLSILPPRYEIAESALLRPVAESEQNALLSPSCKETGDEKSLLRPTE